MENYPNFNHHIQTFYMGRIDKWAKFKRISLSTNGNDTTNYVESSFRILKDKTFQRTKISSALFSYKVKYELII